MSEIVKKDKQEVAVLEELSLDVMNGGVPADFYSNNPCIIGYTYIRFEVSGNITPCCIAKHTIGSAYEQDWRDVWHSGAYESFRRKMTRIHLEKFHKVDPEWTFCQQCSHFDMNKEKNLVLKISRDNE